MLGLDNPVHIVFLLILLLLVFGAKRLPEMGRSLGAGMRGFKDSLSGDDPQSSVTALQPGPARQGSAGSAAPAVTTSAAPVAAPAPAARNSAGCGARRAWRARPGARSAGRRLRWPSPPRA